VSDRDRGRGAELRAALRIQRRVRSRTLSQKRASQHLDEHLQQMNDQASLLDRRPRWMRFLIVPSVTPRRTAASLMVTRSAPLCSDMSLPHTIPHPVG
jgi:hypothetical protein